MFLQYMISTYSQSFKKVFPLLRYCPQSLRSDPHPLATPVPTRIPPPEGTWVLRPPPLHHWTLPLRLSATSTLWQWDTKIGYKAAG